MTLLLQSVCHVGSGRLRVNKAEEIHAIISHEQMVYIFLTAECHCLFFITSRLLLDTNYPFEGDAICIVLHRYLGGQSVPDGSLAR